MTSARELRASLDLARLRRVADGLAARLRLEAGLGGAGPAARGAVLAGIATSRIRE